MSSLWLDTRYALRMMARSPGLTTILVLTLALGIGATTTIFSVINAVLLRPLPYEAPDRLMRVSSAIDGKSGTQQLEMLRASFVDVEQHCRSCAGAGGWRFNTFALSGGDRPVRARITYTQASLWPLLGVRPQLGRWLDAKDDTGDPQVLMLSDHIWRQFFAANPGVIGRQVQVNGKPMTVVGVMPPGFGFPSASLDAWLPINKDFLVDDGGSFNLSLLVRLAPDASPAALQAELDAMAQRWTVEVNKLAAQVGLASFVVHAVVRPLLTDVVGDLSTTLWLLQGAVVFVLLISIVNVANLLLARSEARTREVAIRHALGASRGRLIRQFFTESVLLGGLGGGLGLLVAMWAIDGVTALLPRTAPRANEIALDARVVVFALACALASALVFGLAPILHARRTDLHGALKDGSPRMTGNKARLRVRRALVIGEIALAVVLVVGCTVMVRSFLHLQEVDLGFNPDRVLTFGVALPRTEYARTRAQQFWRQLSDRLAVLPGVRAATLSDEVPLLHPRNIDAIGFPGRSANAPGEPDWLVDEVSIVDEHMIDGLGMRVIRGRGLLATDTEAAPGVALVNESFVAKFFAGRDPIGQQIKLLSGQQPVMTVVGVVDDVKQASVEQDAGTGLYFPLWQMGKLYNQISETEMYAIVRTDGDPSALIPAAQRAVATLDPNVPMFNVRTMDDVTWQAVARPRFLLFLLTSFAGIALLLAAVGIYGVMAHTVAQRTHEIGLRIALGARPAQVRAMVLRQAGGLVAIGVVIGVIGAIVVSTALGASLTGMMYGESLAQPLLYVAVAIAVVITALVATWLPARRATQVQPTVALRSE
jgi:predicted permease